MATVEGQIPRRAAELRSSLNSRRSRQVLSQVISRNLDPRNDAGGVMENLDTMDLRQLPNLRTNDPRTYMDLAIHLLSGRNIGWHIPVTVIDAEETVRDYGKAERYLNQQFSLNDARLTRRGKARIERSVADTFCRMGMTVVYYEALQEEAGMSFLMEPWNPLEVSEELDDEGVGELVRDYKLPINRAISIAEKTETWNTEALKKMADGGARNVELTDWYKVTDGEVEYAVLFKSMVTNTSKDFLAPPVVMEGRDCIPVLIRQVNGEAFPGEETQFAAQSVLEPNMFQYLYDHDLLNMINIQAKRSLSLQLFERTRGRQRVANAGKLLDPNRGPSITTYGTDEPGISTVPINQMDSSVAILESRLQGFLQRGAVPYSLHGNLDIRLSGFAIQQLLEAALAAVGEAQINMRSLFSDLGKWVLDETKGGELGRVRIVGRNPKVVRNGYVTEEFTKADIPDFTDVQAEIELARPSDLLERINIARQALPGRGAIVPFRNIHEHVLNDIVPDSQAAIDEMEWEEIRAMPPVRLARQLAAMTREERRYRESGDMRQADFLVEQIERLEGMIDGRGDANANAPGGGMGGGVGPDGQTLPDAAATPRI